MGWLCTLHPAVLGRIDKKAAVVCAQLDMDAFAAIPTADAVYQEPSKLPGIDIDKGLLSGVTVIDSFEQLGLKSLTLRFAFSSQEKTLSKEEVQPWVDGIVAKLAAMGVALRG